MTTYDRAVIWAVVVLIGVVLAGLASRRRLGACVAWTLYLIAVAATDALVGIWPSRFYTRWFWMLKEAVLDVLKLAIGFELLVRIFSSFPTAYLTARWGAIGAVAMLGVMAASSLSADKDYGALLGHFQSSVNDGTVWLFVALGAFCLWYHVPLDAIHKAILIGLVPFLLMYSVALRALVALGWQRGDIFNATAPLAYLLLLLYWARVAWRRAPDDDAGTRVARMVVDRKA